MDAMSKVQDWTNEKQGLLHKYSYPRPEVDKSHAGPMQLAIITVTVQRSSEYYVTNTSAPWSMPNKMTIQGTHCARSAL